MTVDQFSVIQEKFHSFDTKLDMIYAEFRRHCEEEAGNRKLCDNKIDKAHIRIDGTDKRIDWLMISGILAIVGFIISLWLTRGVL